MYINLKSLAIFKNETMQDIKLKEPAYIAAINRFQDIAYQLSTMTESYLYQTCTYVQRKIPRPK